MESGSIHYLKTKLCVGCTKGFEIVDLETLDTQALLDPQDTSLEFLQKREDAKPLAIYRIENDFLLCYDGEYLKQNYLYFDINLCKQNSPSMLIGVVGGPGRIL